MKHTREKAVVLTLLSALTVGMVVGCSGPVKPAAGTIAEEYTSMQSEEMESSDYLEELEETEETTVLAGLTESAEEIPETLEAVSEGSASGKVEEENEEIQETQAGSETQADPGKENKPDMEITQAGSQTGVQANATTGAIGNVSQTTAAHLPESTAAPAPTQPVSQAADPAPTQPAKQPTVPVPTQPAPQPTTAAPVPETTAAPTTEEPVPETTPAPTQSEYDLTTQEMVRSQVVAGYAQKRAELGLPAITEDATLNAQCQQHADYLAATLGYSNNVTHSREGIHQYESAGQINNAGSTFSARAFETGYSTYYIHCPRLYTGDTQVYGIGVAKNPVLQTFVIVMQGYDHGWNGSDRSQRIRDI